MKISGTINSPLSDVQQGQVFQWNGNLFIRHDGYGTSGLLHNSIPVVGLHDGATYDPPPATRVVIYPDATLIPGKAAN